MILWQMSQESHEPHLKTEIGTNQANKKPQVLEISLKKKLFIYLAALGLKLQQAGPLVAAGGI